MIVAGLQDGEPFVGHVDMIGVHYSEDHVVTGMYVSFDLDCRK